MTGFEPATSGSTIRRSNQLSYTHHGGDDDPVIGRRGILAKWKEVPQLVSAHPLASKAACISPKTMAAAAGSCAA